MQVDCKAEILYSYKELLGEAFYTLIDSNEGNKWRKRCFKDDERIKKIFFDELILYFNCVKYQCKVLNFLFKNEKKLNYNCISRTLDLLEKYGNDNFEHIDSMLAMLKTACQMEADYKYYVPRKKFVYLNNDNYSYFIRLASGFDIQSIKDFFIEHDVFNLEEFNNVYNKAKILPIDCEDTTFIGDFDGGYTLPKVLNDKTALVCVHELVHQALKYNKQYINKDEIVYGEELPIFYEMLYKTYNGLINCDTNYNEISEKLLNTYDSEPFMEQVKKLEKIL